MNEVLSQDEIDQLLSAINSGDSDLENYTAPVNSARKIKIYDFKIIITLVLLIKLFRCVNMYELLLCYA